MSQRNNQWRRRVQSEWGSGSFKRPRPPGLRVKDLGLFYRDQNRRKKNLEYSITLNVPKFVTSKLIHDLEQIRVLAKQCGVETWKSASKFKPTKIKSGGEEDETSTKCKTEDEKDDRIKDTNISLESKSVDKTESDDGNTYGESSEAGCSKIKSNSKEIKLEFKSEYPVKEDPGCSSSLPDFIEIKPDDTDYGIADKRLLSLRGAGDYKYGYNDIITGTFLEKLDENLAKGINIAKINDDIASLNLSLYENHQNTVLKSQYQKMMKFRSTLPTYKKRHELIDIISNNQIVVISGETGCGKSTQVPQIILDDALMNKRGANIKILVTQPRRIAASSLATRVASERAEALGQSVGYAVRLEKVEPRTRGSIMFCTTGILLVDLEVNQGLTDYSHVILDEVHERDVHIDLAMCMLKQVLQKRKDLKLILMSATLDAEKLCSFFDNCPLMHIEGLAYPVKDVYLEEILQLIDFKLPPQQQNNRHQPKYMKYIKHGKARDISEKAIQYRAFIGPWLESIKKKLNPDVYLTLQDHRIEEIHIDLLYELVKFICGGPSGAILVFLPGIGEISKLLNKIKDNASEIDGRFEIYPLHSKLPSLEQHKIFQRPPDNIRKIILATNIAETSITIDDIVYVVDSGKIKYSGLNVEQHINTLNVEWVSQANMRQRRGRAGRCQPGVCYHLVTSYRAERLDERILPELQRSALLEPVLSIKRLRLGKAIDALKNVPDSPAVTTIVRAVKHLQQCGALDSNETLTPLGWHLARLPVHPAAGKLLLFGALFGCLDRAASVAAVWSFKDPFLLMLEKEDQSKAAKRSLALGEPSDHVAISEAVIEYERCPSNERRSFAYDYFLSPSTLELLCDMKKQLGDNLRQMGFLASGRVVSSWENRNADNLSLFKAIVAASLYPNVTAAQWINLNARNPNRQVRVVPRTPDGKVKIHPSSVMCPPQRRSKHKPPKVELCANPGANWLVYWLKQKSSDLFVIDVTLVYTLPILFFGELTVTESDEDPDFYVVSITSYKVRIRKDTAELLFELRGLLDDVLASKISASSDHGVQYSEFEERVLNAVIDVITAEDERAEYLEGSESDASE